MKSVWEDKNFCADSFKLREDFRERAIADMAGAGRRAQRERVVSRVGAVAVFVLAVGVLFLPRKSDLPGRGLAVAEQGPPWMVRTVAFGGVVRSEGISEGMVMRSSEVGKLIVRTEMGAGFEILSDDQMLALLRDRPVALVKMGGRVELEWLGGGP